MKTAPENTRMLTYTPGERQALSQLRRQYLQQEEMWTPTELARLRFVRWLYRTRRCLP